MNLTDTLGAAKALKKSGFTEAQAESLAAQQEAVAQEIVANIGRALEPKFAAINARFDAIDARFVAIDARFVAIDARFVGLEKSIDARFVAIDKSLDLRFAHFEAKMDAKIEAVARDQLFKIVIMLFSSAGLTIAVLSFLFAVFRQ